MRVCLSTVIDKINKFLFIQFLQVIKFPDFVSSEINGINGYARVSLLIFSIATEST